MQAEEIDVWTWRDATSLQWSVAPIQHWDLRPSIVTSVACAPDHRPDAGVRTEGTLVALRANTSEGIGGGGIGWAGAGEAEGFG
jgi:hypothetical protein